MGKNILYFLLLITGLSLTSNQTTPVKSLPVRISFGVKIGLFPTGKLTQYALIYYRNGKLVSIRPIPLNRLLKIGNGKWPLPNSTVFYDYFKHHNIHNDTLPSGKIIDYRAAFDSLWKIQFPIYPYNHQRGKGWSQGKAKPSLQQLAYLYNRYGVRGYNQEYYCDTSFFRLLKDVLDPRWIAHYKSLH